MKKDSTSLDAVVSGRGVKLHHFEPSNRKIWTVVGKDNEHWLDPDMGFCSCEDYYFNAMGTNGECYHLKSVNIAKSQNKVEVIKFSDSEFESFITALVSDLS